MITGVTRKAIVELINTYDPDPLGIGLFSGITGNHKVGITWWGEIEELEFLSRLYDLDNLPSSDDRYANAREDIIQHRENNNDWPNDWIFHDNRFKLNTSDDALLKFLSEVLHPEVRSNTDEVRGIRTEINSLLAMDNYTLKQTGLISGKPVYEPAAVAAKKVSELEIRNQIAYAIRDNLKAYDVEGFCDSLDLPKVSSEDIHAMSSKATYVKDRLRIYDKSKLIKIAQSVYETFEYEPLEELMHRIESESSSTEGAPGNPKNLIFAAKGLKPEIFLSDSIDNEIGFSKYAGNVLVYDEVINANSGLSWQDLLSWWMKREKQTDPELANRTLYTKLRETCNTPEAMILDSYGHILKKHGFDIPAILPQIYLHIDPLTEKQRGGNKILFRQRMDFLLLLPGRIRVVIELDGIQHYADANGKATPVLYAKTMEEDRKLRLRGYQVFRFGGADFVDEEKAKIMMHKFFEELLAKAGIIR